MQANTPPAQGANVVFTTALQAYSDISLPTIFKFAPPLKQRSPTQRNKTPKITSEGE